MRCEIGTEKRKKIAKKNLLEVGARVGRLRFWVPPGPFLASIQSPGLLYIVILLMYYNFLLAFWYNGQPVHVIGRYARTVFCSLAASLSSFCIDIIVFSASSVSL